MPPSPPLEGRVAAHANAESLSDATAFASADERAVQAALESVPREVLAHIVDVHCHPTDSNMAMTLDAMRDIPIRLCAIATRQSDQRLVADLACAYPESVVPCFGWYFTSPIEYLSAFVTPVAASREALIHLNAVLAGVVHGF